MTLQDYHGTSLIYRSESKCGLAVSAIILIAIEISDDNYRHITHHQNMNFSHEDRCFQCQLQSWPVLLLNGKHPNIATNAVHVTSWHSQLRDE